MTFDARALLTELTADPSAATESDPVLDGPDPTPVMPDELPEEWRAHFEERAAIREYNGGQVREHAEAEALRETLAAMRAAGQFTRGG